MANAVKKTISLLGVVKDEPDNRMLECALTGRAQGDCYWRPGAARARELPGRAHSELREYLDTGPT